MEKIRVGKIVNTFGIKGELKVEIITDFPQERFVKDRVLFVEENGKDVPLTLASVRYHKGFALLLFKGLENINLVEKYKGLDLWINKEEIPELKDGYYTFELVGMNAYLEDGTLIGEVTDVEDYPANSVLRVKNGEKEALIPFVDAFVVKVEKQENRILIRNMEGLL